MVRKIRMMGRVCWWGACWTAPWGTGGRLVRCVCSLLLVDPATVVDMDPMRPAHGVEDGQPHIWPSKLSDDRPERGRVGSGGAEWDRMGASGVGGIEWYRVGLGKWHPNGPPPMPDDGEAMCGQRDGIRGGYTLGYALGGFLRLAGCAAVDFPGAETGDRKRAAYGEAGRRSRLQPIPGGWRTSQRSRLPSERWTAGVRQCRCYRSHNQRGSELQSPLGLTHRRDVRKAINAHQQL